MELLQQQHDNISNVSPSCTHNDKNGDVVVTKNRPNLFDTARLGLELSVQKWADINSSLGSSSSSDLCSSGSLEEIAQRIFAILLIRILALYSKKRIPTNIPIFPDLSTTSICHAIISQEDHTTKKKDDDEEQINNGSEYAKLDWPDIMTDEVFSQLYQYIDTILQSYHDVSYHNREHAYHVFMSAHKLLDMVLCEFDYSHGSSSPVTKQSRVTYGLKSDPLVQLAYLFSALVHDVDHTGVSNRQLVMESDELAIMYNDQSVAEQRSLAIAFSLLMTKDFHTLRQVIFQSDGDYMKFRKVVIDLVLCTDIASPERVQIVKSKWKEAFGDKAHAPLSPLHARTSSSCFESVPSCGKGTTLYPPTVEEDWDGAIPSASPMNSTGTVVVSAMNGENGQASDASELRGPVDDSRENSLTLSQSKKRNAWKTEPADDSLRNPGKLRLVYYFFAQRGSMRTGKRTQSRNSCNTDNTMVEREKKSLLRSFKWGARKQKRVSKDSDEPGKDTVEIPSQGIESELLTKTSGKRKVKGKTDAGRTSIETKEDIEQIQDILNEYEEDLSVSSSFSESSTASTRENREVLKRRRSEESSQILSTCKNEFDDISLNDQASRNNSIASCSTMFSTSQYPSKLGPKTSRRFTEPPNPRLDRKRFHLRLGICRALDLPGNQISEYKVKSTPRVENDPDHPNELKMIVVLEQMLKAADVAANMQGWDTMLRWSRRLFNELKASHEDGRGNDPVADWHENQIAFFESYTMPLACRLVETGVFEFHEVQELVNGVRQNNIRWMIEGRLVLDKMVRDWDMLQKKNNSPKRPVTNVESTLPFTKQGKEVRRVINVENRRTILKKEKERVVFLQGLIKSDRHREALRELVSDTTVENPIHYYNKIQHEQQLNGLMSFSNTSTTVASRNEEKSSINAPTESLRTCKWSGLNNKGIEMKCSNVVISLPWRNTREGVFAEATVYLSNFCEYHQKFCLDVDKIHENKLKRIVIPNEIGLCSDCYVVKTGKPPVKLDRCPGLRRKHGIGSSRANKVQPLIIKRSANLGYPNATYESEEQNSKSYNRQMSQVIAATTIRRSLRKSIVRSRKARQYEMDRLENMAAVWLQSFFRYIIIKKRTRSCYANGTVSADVDCATQYGMIAQMVRKCDQGERVDESEKPEHCISSFLISDPQCLPIIPKNDTMDIASDDEIKSEDDCEPQSKQAATTCCTVTSIISKRHEIPEYITDKLENIDAARLQNLVRSSIRHNLPRSDCTHDAPLNVKEVCEKPGKCEATVVRYMTLGTTGGQDACEHADVKEHRDRRTSNFSKPNPDCLPVMEKNSTHDLPINTDNWSCSLACCELGSTGREIRETPPQHSLVPMQQWNHKSNLGFNIFSEIDLKRTFQRQVLPDRQIPVKFQSFRDIDKWNRLNRRRKIQQVKDARRNNVKSTPKKQKSKLQKKEKCAKILPESSILDHEKRDANSPKEIDKTRQSHAIASKPIKFSPTRLSNLLETCFEPRTSPSKKRETTSCPLCKMRFFDNELVQKHIISRHTSQEIECNMKLNDPNIDKDEHQEEMLHVDWKGFSSLVPPLPSPVPQLQICDKHVPSHPMCKVCTDFANSSPLFPPIRFYQQAYMHFCKQDNECAIASERMKRSTRIATETNVVRNFHFDTHDKELAVIFQDSNSKQRVAKLVCLCKDSRNNCYLGVQCYLPCLQDELAYLAQKYNLQKDEWIMDSKVELIDMKTVLGRRHVFLCHANGLDQRRKDITIDMSSGVTFVGNENKFCRFVFKDNDLYPFTP